MQLAGNPFKPPERSSSPRLLAPIGAGAEQHQNQPAKGAKQSHSPWTASKPKKKHRQLHSDEDDTDTPLRVAASLQPQHWADENVPPLPGKKPVRGEGQPRAGAPAAQQDPGSRWRWMDRTGRCAVPGSWAPLVCLGAR